MQKVLWMRKIPTIHPRRNKNKFLNKFSGFKFKRIFIILFVLITIFGLYFLFNNLEVWNVAKFNYIGIKNLTNDQLDASISEFKNKSIFTINPEDVENKLKENYVEISSVRVEKIYKNSLNIYIEEKTPHLLYSNFNGIYLFDDNAEVLKAFSVDSVVKFTKLDYDLVRGFGNKNADYVEDRIFSELPEDEIGEFDFDLYDEAKKEEMLQIIVSERRTTFDNRIEFIEENIEPFLLYQVPHVQAWDERVYKVGDIGNLKTIDFLGNIIVATNNNVSLLVNSGIWDGELRFIANTDTGMNIYFSPARDLKTQVEDLVIILDQEAENIQNIETIDLSSRKVLVDYFE